MTSVNRHPRPAIARRGLVLPLVLITLAIAIILGLSFLTSASTATSLSSAADHRLRARMIAESGLSMTLGYIESERNWRTLRANGAWVTNQARSEERRVGKECSSACGPEEYRRK